MSNLTGRKIKVARFHTACHIEGLGQLTTAVRSEPKGPHVIQLVKVEGGIRVQYGPSVDAYIPDGNIVCLQFEPEVVATPTKK